MNLDPVADVYNKSLEKHGAESPGVGWPDPQSHRMRFDKLVSVIEGDVSNISVNDLGCGYGALYQYLVETGTEIGKYRGYDISSEMLARARELISNDNVELYEAQELDKLADYSIASGIFNVKLKEDEREWVEYVKQTLSNLNECSEKGFAFNLLSSYVDYQEEHLYYGDPLFYFNFCKTRFSRYVSLLHDYPLYEWTIIVRKQ